MRCTLFHSLTETDPAAKFARKSPLTPDSINHFFLETGHMMEYYELGPESKRVVALFWEAGELVIPSHVQSKFLGLDELRPGGVIPYGSMIRALRSDPDFRVNYRDARFDYQKKVYARLRSLTRMDAKERWRHLKIEQPWVFDLVAEEDITNYLRLDVGVLRRLRGV